MIATILMVAITVVLAAVLYVMVVNLIDPDINQKPIVTLSAECTPAECEGQVTGAQPAADLAKFRVSVFADGVRAIPVTALAADTDITGGGLTFRYTDVGAEGRVTAGDTFRLTGLSAGVEYEIVLLWQNGDVVDSIAGTA